MATMATQYLYLGIMGALDRSESQLRTKIFNKRITLPALKRDNPRNGEWGKMIKAMSVKIEENRFKDSQEIMLRLIKAVMGDAHTTSDNVLVWRTMADSAFNTIANNHWDMTTRLEGRSFNKDNKLETPYLLFQDYFQRVQQVLEAEKEIFQKTCVRLQYYVDDPENPESWKHVTEDALCYLKDCNTLYGISYPPFLENNIRSTKNSADTLVAIIKNGKDICAAGQYSNMLSFFSSDPTEFHLQKAINAFDQLQDFAEKQRIKYENAIENIRETNPVSEETAEALAVIEKLMARINPEEEAE